MVLRATLLPGALRLTVVILFMGVINGRPVPESAASAGAATEAFRQSTLPVPGVYRYSVHGNECASVTVFQICRSFPSQATIVLTRATGTLTVEADLSSNHLEASRFALRSDGRYLIWQRTKLVFGIAQDDSAPTVPPTLALPSTLRVGQRWTQRFTTGGLPVVTTNQVVGQTTMRIGGTSVTTYEIDADSQTGGAHPGTERDITWHAPGSALDVRLVVHRRIGGVFPYKMDLDATLLSLQPIG